MKTKIIFFTAILLSGVFSAQQMKNYQFGTPFTISFPNGYVKSYDLNDVAAAQFSNSVNDKYSIVIQTEKENLTFFQLAFSTIEEAGEYYSKSIKDGLVDDATLKYIKPKEVKISDYAAAESIVEGSFIDEETSLTTPLFYHITIVETANYYFQIISWSSSEDKNKNLEEFRKIAQSFKEVK